MILITSCEMCSVAAIDKSAFTFLSIISIF